MKKLILLPILFLALTSLAQTKLTIQSSTSENCTSVGSAAPNNIFGDNGFVASRAPFGSGFEIARSFLQFDLSSIPTGSFVNWARLSLFAMPFQQNGPNNALLRRVTSAWSPAMTTWNNQPTTAKRGTIRLAVSRNRSENYQNIIVTNLVQTMVDSPAASFGFALRLDTDGRGSVIRTMEFSSPGDNRGTQTIPLLTMEYTTPGFQPAITSMLVDLSRASTEMTIYPNPCNKAFNCNIQSANSGNMFLKVIDMLGRTVYTQPVNASNLRTRINLPSSSAGTYFVVLQDSKSATIVSQELRVNE